MCEGKCYWGKEVESRSLSWAFKKAVQQVDSLSELLTVLTLQQVPNVVNWPNRVSEWMTRCFLSYFACGGDIVLLAHNLAQYGLGSGIQLANFWHLHFLIRMNILQTKLNIFRIKLDALLSKTWDQINHPLKENELLSHYTGTSMKR